MGRCLRGRVNVKNLRGSKKTVGGYESNTMAEQNVPTQPPTRTDEQIVPHSQWLTIGKSNLLFNAQKIQKNPIFNISRHPDVWKTMSYNEKTGVYSFKLLNNGSNLMLNSSKGISNYLLQRQLIHFELPPSGNTVIDFVNELGYPEPVEIERLLAVTNPKHQLSAKCPPVGKRHSKTNVIMPELIWEEFTQGNPRHFLTQASLNASLKNPKKKVTPLLIPYGRFSKVIIYYLASNNNIHRRPDSAIHHTGEDYVLGNLKFVPKGESVEVFGMAIPDPLITEAIQQSSYYPKYLKMVAENTKKTPRESASAQPATKRAAPKKPATTTPVKQSKQAPPPTKKPSTRKLPQKVRRGKPTFKLVDEDDEAQQETIPHEEGNDPDL
ncbi:hypothetical protein Tco_0637006, partial [Tanacetum coccineum]